MGAAALPVADLVVKKVNYVPVVSKYTHAGPNMDVMCGITAIWSILH